MKSFTKKNKVDTLTAVDLKLTIKLRPFGQRGTSVRRESVISEIQSPQAQTIFFEEWTKPV